MTKRVIKGVCFDECPKKDLGSYEPIPRPKPSQCDCDFSDYYTKEEVNTIISTIATGQFLVVDELPEVSEPKTIYLVPKENVGERNIYSEYIYVQDHWELIGDTEIDLTQYVKKDEFIRELAKKQDLLSKQDVLDILGDTEIPLSMEDKDGVETNVMIVGNVV